MFSARRRGVARLAAATLVSGLVAAGTIAIAGPAMADEISTGGAAATLSTSVVEGGDIAIEVRGETDTVRGGLFNLEVKGGGSLKAYCIDLFTGTKVGTSYKEVGWDESTLHNNKNAGKIRWILQHSYPEVNDLAALASKANAKSLTNDDAAAATQAAIWHFSDNVKTAPKDADANALTEYLVAEAEKAPDQEEPKASLSVSPTSIGGKAGGRLGPAKVTTNAAAGVTKVSLSADAPQGVKVVDKAGKAITSVSNGDELYLDVPAGTGDGSAKVNLQSTTKVSIGRVFASTTEKRRQTLILAGSSDSTVTAQIDATWAKQGAVPAVDFKENCAKGGVDITVSNKGDEDWTFELKGQTYKIAPGASETITVPVAEDEAYKFTITGPNEFEKVIEGVLDCKTATPGPKPSETPSGTPSPSETPATGGTTGSTGSTTGGGDLAETGGSSATPMIAGVAVALVVVGGGAVFFLRKKKAAGH
ncbi:Cys-Gln thioester bond-forming surface protein [Streptomyces showdoensis]|uniref:Peptidase n=1 Tax=Streptomyces showdoensis TaxID=68268 RepID=A0A2P2GT35_STREW|nr:Cys-Gln thioester bond-forming surface protein [Streptomyces showdoensis]KKZ74105.1 peptidase [Streptomyces showdoensis]